MEDREDIPPPSRIGRESSARSETSQGRASARRLALERTEKWRLADKTVWPPPPKKPAETARRRPKRKGGNGVLAVFGVVFVSVWAFLIGLAAGIGHKDFSESLASNVGNTLFDVLLWVLVILYWVDVARKQWQTLRANPRPLRTAAFYVTVVLLLVAYGSGVYVSLACLIARAAASDTTF